MEGNKSIKYIYDLPFLEREKLCSILDIQDKWKELGGKYMKFDVITMEAIGREFLRGGSPTDTLLTRWGFQNHNITELFILLSKMHHYQAMTILKPFVNQKYHQLIYEGEEMMSKLISKPLGPSAPPNSNLLTSTKKIHQSNTQNENFNFEAKSVLDNTHKNVLEVKREEKILNKPNTKQIGKERQEGAWGPPPKDTNSSMMDSLGRVPPIDYEELVDATDNWSTNKILGKGGFGTVFKGKWKNIDVAIKRIDKRMKQTEEESLQQERTQSQRELRALNHFRHDNILPLYGYSEGAHYCLVYQFMPNGTLEDCLRCKNNSSPLDWNKRLGIAKGVAKGLQFLHSSKQPIVHGDIKSANILIDKNYEARIGDFGLARDGPSKEVTHIQVSQIHGTKAYLPMDYLRSRKMSPKVDTYSFGIVMLELATCLKVHDRERPKPFLMDYVASFDEHTAPIELRDRKALPNDDAVAIPICREFLNIGLLCASKIPQTRPDMQNVVLRLERVVIPLHSQFIPPDRRSCPQTPQLMSPYNRWCKTPEPPFIAPGTYTPLLAFQGPNLNSPIIHQPLAVNTNFSQHPSTFGVTISPQPPNQPVLISPQSLSPHQQPIIVTARSMMNTLHPLQSPINLPSVNQERKEKSEEKDNLPLISMLGISDAKEKTEKIETKSSSDEQESPEKNNDNDLSVELVSSAHNSNVSVVESTAQEKISCIFQS